MQPRSLTAHRYVSALCMHFETHGVQSNAEFLKCMYPEQTSTQMNDTNGIFFAAIVYWKLFDRNTNSAVTIERIITNTYIEIISYLRVSRDVIGVVLYFIDKIDEQI